MVDCILEFRPRTRWFQTGAAWIYERLSDIDLRLFLYIILGMMLWGVIQGFAEVACTRDPIRATCVVPEGGKLLEVWGNGWYLIEAHGDTFLLIVNGKKPWAITQYSRKE